jgi:hypothetical protein
MTLMGDSFTEGTGADVGFFEAVVMARALGMSAALAGVGSTGMLKPGVNNVFGQPLVPFTNATRLKDLTLAGATSAHTGTSAVPNIGVVFGSLNDNAFDYAGAGYASLTDGIVDRSLTIVDAWVAANPGKPLVFFGPTWPSGPPSNRAPLDIFRIRDGIQRAAFMAASDNVHFADRLEPQMREGVYSTATDQAFLYTGGSDGTDATHPTPAGHRFDGLHMAGLLKTLIFGAIA